MFLRNVLLLLSFCISTTIAAQNSKPTTPADIYNQLLQLQNCNTVLYIAAHPDDENTRLLAWLANVKHYRTAYLSLTRGDGGQNLIGNEQGIPLGIIRTQELLAARRIDGAEQYFTRAYDFGFSKTSEESLNFWGKDEILADVVWVIRTLKPDVIISRFPKDKRAGHGHHASAGILAEEAFKAAADPTKFTEQLQFVKPWQAKRVLWNSFNFGGNNTTNDNQFKIITGDYVSALGKSVGEIAAESRSMHKSQGFGVPMQRGNITEYFETWGGEAPTKTLLDGVNSNWSSVAGGETIDAAIETIIKNYDYKNPQASSLPLTDLYKLINGLPNEYHLKNYKLQKVKQLITACSGLYMEALSNQIFYAATDSCRIAFGFINRSDAPIKFIAAKALNSTIDLKSIKALKDNNNMLANNTWYNGSDLIFIKNDLPLSNPYWINNSITHNRFNVSNQNKIGLAEDRNAYMAEITFNIHGTDIQFEIPIQNKNVDPVKGEILQPIQIVPKMTLMPDANVILTKQKAAPKLTYSVKHFLGGASKKFNSPLKMDVDTVSKGAVKKFETTNFINENELSLTHSDDTKNYNTTLYEINYDHIPQQIYYNNATVKLINSPINISPKKVGYIIGAGDKIMQGLEQLGYNVTVIEKHQITLDYLKKFDAIITGVRAYNTNAWLNDSYETLMKFVQNGGNLIVQYNTNSGVGPLKINIGPYPFTISRTRVTEEDAKVTYNLPQHIVFNKPNKIEPTDWLGWVQERSIYHAEKYDSAKYITPIAMNDKDEKPDNGSLLIAPYGKGNFVYTGLVFFRQIPAGVIGAYKLLANLIQLPKN